MPKGAGRVAVIGGGAVGCAVAHALARRQVPVVLLEAEAELATGASAANSGIMHTGFDSKPGELETRLIIRAGELRERLLGELGVEVWRCGAVLTPRGEEEREAVRLLAANARANGVEARLEGDGSLLVPGETVSDPLAYVLALAGAARAGGAEVRTAARVEGIRAAGEGALELELQGGGRTDARAVVNCAGLRADELARMAGDELPAIYPRKGEFLVFEAPAGEPALERILLPVPSQMGKGVLVFPTLDRRHVIAGPTAREREDKEDWSVEGDARELILPRAAAMYPALEQARPLGAYAGLRTAGHGGANYVIERSRATPGVIHVAAIRSTGLSASLAIGELVAGMLAEDGRVELGPPRALECDGCATPRYEPAPAAGEGSTAVPWWEWGSRHRGARR